MTTEQTGRHDIDSTDSQARIEPKTLVAAPPGGDPTPLPRRRAAHGTRTGMRAAPPPIPDATQYKLTAAPPRTKTMPPPIPTASNAALEIAAIAGEPAGYSRGSAANMSNSSKSPLPDPDGWSLPATIEASGSKLPSVYHPEPAAPDATAPLDYVEPAAAPLAAIDAEPSAEWLAKINAVLAPEGAAAPDEAAKIEAAHALAVAATAQAEAARARADAIARAEADAIARAEAEIYARNAARAEAKAAAKGADADAEAAALAKANAAANASLPKLPSARPSGAKLPPPRAGSTTRPPLAIGTPAPVLQRPDVAVAAAAASMFTTAAEPPTAKANATETSQLELVDLEPVETPAAAQPVVAHPAGSPVDGLPVVQTAKPAVSPLVAAAQASLQAEQSFDIEWNDNPDLTSAHTTNFEMPTKSKLPNRAVIGLAVAAAFATVGYLATRSTKSTKHTPVATAKAAPAAEAPAPAAEAPAAPAAEAPAPAAPVAQAAAAPAAATPNGIQLVQMPVSSTPSGALVSFVDGNHAEIVGRTPTTITLDASKPHDIAFTLVGHETQLEHIPVGGKTALAVSLPAKEGTREVATQTPAQPAVAAAVAPHEETAPARAAHHEEPAHHASRPAPTEHVMTQAPRAETPSGSGTLMISSKPPCEIVVDGRSTHLQTPQKAIPLAPGTHTIVLVNAAQHIHKTVAVDIVAKKPTKVIQDFTKH